MNVRKYFNFFSSKNECEGGWFTKQYIKIFLLLYDIEIHLLSIYTAHGMIKMLLQFARERWHAWVCVIFSIIPIWHIVNGIEFNFQSKNAYTMTINGTKYIWFLFIWWTVKIFYDGILNTMYKYLIIFGHVYYLIKYPGNGIIQQQQQLKHVNTLRYTHTNTFFTFVTSLTQRLIILEDGGFSKGIILCDKWYTAEWMYQTNGLV